MTRTSHGERRRFLKATGAAAAAALLGGCAPKAERPEAEAGVTPAEDLMREHGVLRRVLLVYEEAVRRMNDGDFPPQAFRDAGGIVRRFVEDYHEKLEEDHVFGRFEKAGKLADLVKTLRAQHDAGRKLTAEILRLADAPCPISEADRTALTAAVRAFARMYRPHAGREDTVLFPALRDVCTPKDYAELGEAFEAQEDKLFGAGGFEKVVAQVAAIERTLGIEDLAQFTPAAAAGSGDAGP